MVLVGRARNTRANELVAGLAEHTCDGRGVRGTGGHADCGMTESAVGKRVGVGLVVIIGGRMAGRGGRKDI